MPVRVGDYALDIAPSIRGEFLTAAELSSLIKLALRSTPDPRSLVAKRLVYVDGLRTNSRLSSSTDFLKQSERRFRG
jgi:hypothetical protein